MRRFSGCYGHKKGSHGKSIEGGTKRGFKEPIRRLPPCANRRCPQQKEIKNGECGYWADCPLFQSEAAGVDMTVAAQQRQSKYGAEKTVVDGMTFDSRKEANRWGELCLLERAGEIKNLRRQVEYVLIPEKREPPTVGKRGGVKEGRVIQKAVKYKADFVYEDKEGKTIVEDVKGYKGGGAYAVFVIKKKLMCQVFGIDVREI